MKSKIVVCALFTLFAMACLPAHAQTINTNGVCENDIPPPNNCLPNDEYNDTYLEIFGHNLGTAYEVTVTTSGVTTPLPILSNNGIQIDVCLALTVALPVRNATLTVHTATGSPSINISEIDAYNNGSGFHPPITIRKCT